MVTLFLSPLRYGTNSSEDFSSLNIKKYLKTFLSFYPFIANKEIILSHTYIMGGSRKFCQRGSNNDKGFSVVFLVDEGRKDPNTTISGPPSAHQ